MPRGRIGRATTAGRRAWPLLLAAWQRWQALPEEDKERYRSQARGYADRGRKAMAARRNRGGRLR